MTRIWSKLRVLPPEPLPMPDPYEQFPKFRPTQNHTDLIEYLHKRFSFALTVSKHTYSFDKCSNSVMVDILYELTRFGFIGLDAAARVDDNQRGYDFQQVQCMGYLDWALMPHYGIMSSWHHGIMASWNHGIMASWHHGIMASWHHGIMASWHHGIMEQHPLADSNQMHQCKSSLSPT